MYKKQYSGLRSATTVINIQETLLGVELHNVCVGPVTAVVIQPVCKHLISLLNNLTLFYFTPGT